MDSLSFDLLKLGYHLALAVIVGGGLVLGLAVAPAIFRTARTRGEAGTVFGSVLAGFDVLALLALVVVVVTSLLKASAFETIGTPQIARWVALGVMGLGTLYASAWANPIARSLRAQAPAWDDLPDSSPLRREFAVLHARSRRAMSVAILAGVVALLFS